MTRSPRRFHIVALSILLIACGACVPVLRVVVRTRILQDGTAIRETRIVKERRKGNNDEESAWNERPISEDLGERLGIGFPHVERSDDEIVLRGIFPDPNEIPSDFQRDVALLDRTSRNQVSFKTEDLLLATRYLYRERFSDAIPKEDQVAAKERLVGMVVKFLRASAKIEFGQKYDVTDLNHYLGDSVEAALVEIVDVYWSERRTLSGNDPVTGESGLDRGVRRALKIVGRLGLELSTEESEDENLVHLRDYLCGLLAATLVPKQGTATPPAPSEFYYLMPPNSPLERLATLGEITAQREYGSLELATEEFKRRLLGVTGTFGAPPAEAEFHFDCAVEMPGFLLRTNGILEGDGSLPTNSAFFLFNGDDIYPDGYPLELESVVVHTARIASIRELKPSFGRREAVEMILALDGVPAEERAVMSQLLARCATQGTLKELGIRGENEPVPDWVDAKVRDKMLDLLQPFLRE